MAPGSLRGLRARHAVDVEMLVARRQQYIGFGKQQPGQRHPHAPSTGQLTHRPLAITGREAETREYAMGLRFEGIPTELFVATVLVAVEGESAIANGGIVGRHLMFELVDAVCERIEVLRARHGRLEDRAVGCLCEIWGRYPI